LNAVRLQHTPPLGVVCTANESPLPGATFDTWFAMINVHSDVSRFILGLGFVG
jgi:hypothetical protein